MKMLFGIMMEILGMKFSGIFLVEWLISNLAFYDVIITVNYKSLTNFTYVLSVCFLLESFLTCFDKSKHIPSFYLPFLIEFNWKGQSDKLVIIR